MSYPRSCALVLAAGILAISPVGAAAQDFDLAIRGGMVIDGSGSPPFRADVGVREGIIVAVGDLSGQTATRTIDVEGLHILPGFVDMHSHAADVAWEEEGFDSPDAARRAAPNLVAQGITTVAVNQDGRSPVDVAAQAARYAESGIGLNTLLMVGHGSVRGAVMGDDYRRPASPEEIGRMRHLVRRAMEAGATGLSAGLEYSPGRWSATDEVAALTEEIVPFNGVYIAHQRSEGPDPMWFWPSRDSADVPSLLDAVRETIEIGERTGARVVASHIKAKGAHYWGTSAEAAALIQSARERGVDVWADQYPYTTSGSDGSTLLIPRWVFTLEVAAPGEDVDFATRVSRALESGEWRTAIERDIAHEIRRRGGAGRILILEHPDSTFRGQTLEAVAARFGTDPVSAAIALQMNGFRDRRGGAAIRGFSMDEQDVDHYAAFDWVATASDAGIALAGDPAVHPRYWGTFPRKIRRYAVERGVMAIPAAVRSATSLPAMLLGLDDRGLIRSGLVADLVVVDLERLRDRSTALDPHAEPEGVIHVWIGGEAAVVNGRRTGALIGRVLKPSRSTKDG